MLFMSWLEFSDFLLLLLLVSSIITSSDSSSLALLRRTRLSDVAVVDLSSPSNGDRASATSDSNSSDSDKSSVSSYLLLLVCWLLSMVLNELLSKILNGLE